SVFDEESGTLPGRRALSVADQLPQSQRVEDGMAGVVVVEVDVNVVPAVPLFGDPVRPRPQPLPRITAGVGLARRPVEPHIHRPRGPAPATPGTRLPTPAGRTSC